MNPKLIKKKPKQYEFPIFLTKCRYCGHINEWSGGVEGENWDHRILYDMAEGFKVIDCQGCKLDYTVQDYVAFINPTTNG